MSGFIPLSQLSDHYVENAEEFVGQTMEVRVSRVDQRRNRAVFSHKLFLNEEKDKLVAEIWENLNVDDVVEGTVMRFTDYGAFVDIGGIDGLLHISEISWGKLKHPQEVLSIGQKINVKVLSMNAEKGKISLGLKQNQPEPWSVIDENYQVGQVIEGKVVQMCIRDRFRALEKRKQQERESVIRQLPEFVNRLVLLLNAGLVLSTAFERSVEESMELSDTKDDYFYGTLREIYVNVKTANGSIDVYKRQVLIK